MRGKVGFMVVPHKEVEGHPETDHRLLADFHSAADRGVRIPVGASAGDQVGAPGEEPGILRPADPLASAVDHKIRTHADPAT